MDDDDDAVICCRALRVRGGWFGGTGRKQTRERQDCYLGSMSWGNCISHQNRGHTILGYDIYQATLLSEEQIRVRKKPCYPSFPSVQKPSIIITASPHSEGPGGCGATPYDCRGVFFRWRGIKTTTLSFLIRACRKYHTMPIQIKHSQGLCLSPNSGRRAT